MKVAIVAVCMLCACGMGWGQMKPPATDTSGVIEFTKPLNIASTYATEHNLEVQDSIGHLVGCKMKDGNVSHCEMDKGATIERIMQVWLDGATQSQADYFALNEEWRHIVQSHIDDMRKIAKRISKPKATAP